VDGTPHLVVGAVLSRRLHPLLAVAVGMASHAVLDAIPHYNYTGWRPFSPIMLVDALVGTALVLAVALTASRPWSVLAGAAGAIFPEVERVLSGARFDLLHRLPLSLPNSDIGLPWGLLTQIGVTLLALGVAMRPLVRRGSAGARGG